MTDSFALELLHARGGKRVIFLLIAGVVVRSGSYIYIQLYVARKNANTALLQL